MNLVPGPGTYKYFSEWGLYESKYVSKPLETSSPNLDM